jgi:hypothetical protein
MDETGTDLTSGASPSCSNIKPVVVNHVMGRPEEIYWERVPVKIRRAAVEKAIKLMDDECESIDGDSERRKRVYDMDVSSLENKRMRL